MLQISIFYTYLYLFALLLWWGDDCLVAALCGLTIVIAAVRNVIRRRCFRRKRNLRCRGQAVCRCRVPYGPQQ